MGRKNGVNKKCFLDLSILSAMQQGLEKPQLLEMYTIYIIRLVGLEGLYGVSFPP